MVPSPSYRFSCRLLLCAPVIHLNMIDWGINYYYPNIGGDLSTHNLFFSFQSDRSCLEMTVRMSNTVNTVAAISTLIGRGTSQMPACTRIRGTTTTLMQSNTVDRSEAIKTRMKMTRMRATGQMGEAQLAVGSLAQAALAPTGAVCVQTEGTYLKMYKNVIHV